MKPLAKDSFPCNREIKGHAAKISLVRGNKLDRDLKFSFQSQLLKWQLRTTSSTDIHIFSIQSDRVIGENMSLLLNDTHRILRGKDHHSHRVKHLHYALKIPSQYLL